MLIQVKLVNHHCLQKGDNSGMIKVNSLKTKGGKRIKLKQV